MKNLLLALLLISAASFADWGDVYYCKPIINSSTLGDSYVDTISLYKGTILENKKTFTLRVDKASEALILENGTKETILPLKKDFYDAEAGFYIVDGSARFAALTPVYDDDGNIAGSTLIYSWLRQSDASFLSHTVSADCDKI